MVTEANRTVACPSCKSTSVSRSHRRNLLERLLRPVMTPYRCQLCGQRFFHTEFPETRTRLALQTLPVPVMIAIAVVAVALWPIRRQVARLFSPAASLLGSGINSLHPGILSITLFIGALLACALMLLGVLHSARVNALADIRYRLRKVEDFVTSREADALMTEEVAEDGGEPSSATDAEGGAEQTAARVVPQLAALRAQVAGTASLRPEVERVGAEVRALRTDMSALQAMGPELERLSTDVAAVRGELAAANTERQSELEALGSELRTGIAG